MKKLILKKMCIWFLNLKTRLLKFLPNFNVQKMHFEAEKN